jgi:hypothetical protein
MTNILFIITLSFAAAFLAAILFGKQGKRKVTIEQWEEHWTKNK